MSEENKIKEKVSTLRKTILEIVKLASSKPASIEIANALKPFTVFRGEFNEEDYNEYFASLIKAMTDDLAWPVVAENMTTPTIFMVGVINTIMVHDKVETQYSREVVNNLLKILSINRDILTTHFDNSRITSLSNSAAILRESEIDSLESIVKVIMILATKSDDLQKLLMSSTDIDETFKIFNEHVALLRSEHDVRVSESKHEKETKGTE